MRKFKLGEKVFEIGVVSFDLVQKLKEKLDLLKTPELDENNRVDIGDVILLIMFVVFENEDRAYEAGKALVEEEGERITIDQLREAILTICEACEEV